MFTLPLVRRRDACGLCFAERLWRWPGIRCGGDSDESYRRLLSRLRCGGDFGGNYHLLHNRRRRDACYPGCAAGATLVEITTSYTTDAGETPAIQAAQRGRLWWKLPPPAQPTQARRLRSLLCRAPSAMAMLRCGGDSDEDYYLLHNRRRRDACDLCFAERLKAMARLRCGGDSGGNYHRLHNRRRRDACYPGCAAGATLTKVTDACFPGCAAGATTVEITTAYTTDAGETPAFSALQSA